MKLPVVLTLLISLFGYASSAQAFFPEAAASSFDIGVGYRKDRIEWKAKADTDSSSDSSYSSYYDSSYSSGSHSKSNCSCECDNTACKTKLRDLQIWGIEARGKYVTCDNVYLRGLIDYGWVTNGKRHFDCDGSYYSEDGEVFANGSGSSSHSHHRKVRGHVYDVKLAIGYLMQFCDNTFSLAPVLGYSWHGQNLKRHHHSDYCSSYYSYSSEECAEPYYSSSSDSSSTHHRNTYDARWDGFFVGLDGAYRFCVCSVPDMELFFAYEFHWAHYHASGSENNEFVSGKFHHSARSGIGNVIDIGITKEFCDWTVSLYGDFQWWHVGHGRDYRDISLVSDLRDPCRRLNLHERLKLSHVKWQSAKIVLDVGLVF